MAESFQNEIPKARVNITLDVETGGAKKKMELPLKLLTVGDFSNGKAGGRLADRERININKENLESVLSDFSPGCRFSVPNTIKDDETEIAVDLTFKSYKDFHPESVARQVPAVHNLIAMRNLLKDLKSNLLDNGSFRKELERIVRTQPELDDLKTELEKVTLADAPERPEDSAESSDTSE